MKETVLVIQCPSCSGAMYADQKTAGYLCPFCGNVIPWTEENFYRASPITFRHQPVEQIEGLLKLSHVEVMGAVDAHDERVLSQKYRLHSVAEKLTLWDPTTTKALAGVTEVTFPCPLCAGEVTGESTQHIFACGYCGNKFGAQEVLTPGSYRKKFVMGVGAENVPGKAIPFTLTKEAAQNAARALVQKFPQAFLGQDMERRIREELTAIYLPFSLADMRVKVSVESNAGDFQAYTEILNWACPDTTLCDIHLLDRLDPWDFGAVTPFDPAFAEGVFRIAAVANNVSRSDVIDNLLAERLSADLKEAFSLKKAALTAWGKDFRKHQSAFFLLPVYYLDRRPEDTETDRQVRLAVNGQTGKAAALFYRYGKEEAYRTLEKSRPKTPSPEHTVRTPPLPIRRVKPPFLHRVVPLDDALEKKGIQKFLARFGLFS
ncbi:MAG: hypothetical protein ACTTKW_09720 [Schwartzia sp. (in: firmicutes)]